MPIFFAIVGLPKENNKKLLVFYTGIAAGKKTPL